MPRRLTKNHLLVLFKVFHEITGDLRFAAALRYRIFAIVADRPFLKNNHPNHTMKHSEWLRLQAEGDRVVASLRADGFNCRKQPRRLSWYLCSCSVSYTLTWLPAPVREWSLFPNDETPDRAQLLAQIHSILEHRGCGRIAEPSPPSTQSFWNQKGYPWTLVRLLPNAQHYTVGRFYSRTEAENHKRFLGKWMPAAEFEVVFDADGVT
jgi:hypothetical protein